MRTWRRTWRPDPLRLLLGLSGWLALLTLALPAADPVRTAVAGAFVLLCPGAAATLPAPGRPRATGWPERLTTALLTVALSAAFATVTAVALFLAHAFTPGRALAVLALLTSLLVLLPGRRGRRPARGVPGSGAGPDVPATADPVPGAPTRATPAAPARRRHLAGRTGVLVCGCLLLCTAACGSPAAAGLRVGPPDRSGAAPGPATSSDQPVAPGPWRQVFRDDFDGPALDTANWVTCYDWNDGGCTNAGNHEQQWYLPGQARVDSGALVLAADRRATPGTDGKTYPWTSGMVSTGRSSWNAAPLHTFTYGWFAAALQTPADPEGMFPAFWLIPAETRGTPPELDIAEFPGSSSFVDLNVHWRAPDGTDDRVGHRYQSTDFSAGLRVFAVDWEPGSVTWYVDGVEQFRVTDPVAVPHVAMELILNLAVGYPTSPPPSVDAAQLRVDWVAVWQH
ncbi:glycoside hydrolase family 16 protein [Kitasatospora sp. NPDC094015]|uniref:glycoside hydrolase family 16 protein n=1 Tax=Kitasatospora sp. NPDC094015 TaxID=3155205 RepID=UPI00332DFEB5